MDDAPRATTDGRDPRQRRVETSPSASAGPTGSPRRARAAAVAKEGKEWLAEGRKEGGKEAGRQESSFLPELSR